MEADEARVLQQVSVQAVVKSSRMLEVDTCSGACARAMSMTAHMHRRCPPCQTSVTRALSCASRCAAAPSASVVH